MRSISLDRHKPRRWWLQPLGFLMLAMCLAASAKVVWDLRAASMPTSMARDVVDSDDEARLLAAVVTMHRENAANNARLLVLLSHPLASIRKQAQLALDYQRKQIR